jgi:outer membrane protein
MPKTKYNHQIHNYMEQKPSQSFLLKHGLLLLILIFINAGKAFSQSTLENRTSLKQCLDLALTHHASIKTANFNLEKAKEDSRQNFSSGLPQVSASGSYENYFKIPTQLIPGEFFGYPAGTLVPVQFGTKHNITGSVDATQLIFNKTWFESLKLYKQMIEEATISQQKSREEVIYEISKLYYSLQVMAEQIETMKGSKLKLDTVSDIVTAQVKQGFAKQTDADRVKISSLNLLTQIESLQNLYEAQLSLLKYRMGMNETQPLELEKVNETIETETSATPDLKQNSDLMLIRMKGSMAKQNINLQRASFFPTLAAFGKYSFQSQSNDFKPFDSSNEWYKIAFVGVQLNVPIFTGFRNSAAIQKAKLDLKISELVLNDSEQQLKIQYKNALNNLYTARFVAERQQLNFKLADDVYKQSLVQYKQGVTSLTDLLNAETLRLEARANYLKAINDIRLARIEIFKLNGTTEQLTR